MTLDEFLKSAAETLAAFEASTREKAQTDASMDPNMHRPESWWWRDVAAYLDYVDLEEKITLMEGRKP